MWLVREQIQTISHLDWRGRAHSWKWLPSPLPHHGLSVKMRTGEVQATTGNKRNRYCHAIQRWTDKQPGIPEEVRRTTIIKRHHIKKLE